MSFRAPTVSWNSGDGVPDQFPAGLRVLVVDDDPTCLLILEKMLKNCLYEVTKCNRADSALKLLRDNRDGYDVVISDVHMPDVDGFKLLEYVGLEMDLPVIMMSADDSKAVVMKGVIHGACDYLIKPVRMEALKNVWQHVVRKKKHELREKDNHEQQSGSNEESDRRLKTSEDINNYSCTNEGNNSKSSSKKRKDEDDEVGDERDDTSAMKKPRVVWSVELHQQFVSAVNHLGIDSKEAVPKKILELMNVPGLTRENVASHLQKYRLYLKRLTCGQQHNVYGNPFMNPSDLISNGFDFHTMTSSTQLPPQSLATIQAGRAVTNRPAIVDQRNIFSFENPRNSKFVDSPPPPQQLINNKQPNLLHGVPTNLNLPSMDLVRAQPYPRNHPMINPSMDLVPNASSSSSSLVHFSSSQRMDNAPPNYNLFSNVSQSRNEDWGLQSRGPTFGGSHSQHSMQARVDVAPSVLVQPGFSSDQRSVHIRTSSSVSNTNLGQQLASVRPERLPDMGFRASSPFSGHDDLLSAFFKQPGEGGVRGESDLGFDGYHLDDLPV